MKLCAIFPADYLSRQRSPRGASPCSGPHQPLADPPGVGATVVVRRAPSRCTPWCTARYSLHSMHPTARFVTWELVWGAWVRYALSRIRPYFSLRKNNSIHSTHISWCPRILHALLTWVRKDPRKTDWVA